jgi:hypothetical protein
MGIHGKSGRYSQNGDQVELRIDLKEQLIRRMHRFTNKLHQGITSSAYLDKIDSDAFIKNITIYSGFLNKLYERLGSSLYSREQLVEEYQKIMQAMMAYCEAHVLDSSRDEVQYLLVQMLTTIIVRDYLLNDEDNYNLVRAEKTKLGLQLKWLHQHLQAIRESYSTYIEQISKDLPLFQLNASREEIEKILENIFPFITYNQFIEKLKYFEDINKDRLPTLEDPKVICERELKLFSYEFNIIQLNLLYSMLTVSEWDNQSAFYIIWNNKNKKSNLKRFVLYYNKKKWILKKKYVYQNDLEPRIEEKRHVSVPQLISAANKGAFNILADGFKQI